MILTKISGITGGICGLQSIKAASTPWDLWQTPTPGAGNIFPETPRVDQVFPSIFPVVDHYFLGVGGSNFSWRVDHFFLDNRRRTYSL